MPPKSKKDEKKRKEIVEKASSGKKVEKSELDLLQVKHIVKVLKNLNVSKEDIAAIQKKPKPKPGLLKKLLEVLQTKSEGGSSPEHHASAGGWDAPPGLGKAQFCALYLVGAGGPS